MWKESTYTGAVVPFSPIFPEDDYLHPVASNMPFTGIETYLCGFNIPGEDINCNIYLLWHTVLRTLSMHVLVYRGKPIFPHQLAADYVVDQLFFPMGDSDRDFHVEMGSCAARVRIVQPLDEMLIEIDDTQRNFALGLKYRAAMPPVGRPGGHHFTQLMRTSGALKLDGKSYVIDGFYMRDRSWGYQRPEQAERTPPYRWITGWFGADSGFVLAWIDTGFFDGEEFGPNWHSLVGGKDGEGVNKWESGGPTPSLNLRSGWFAVNGEARPVVRLGVRTQLAEGSNLLVKAIELEIEDAEGDVHHVTGEITSMIPKMTWLNMVTYMYAMRLQCNGRSGNGDLMDTYTTHHIRRFGL